jgi:hypothetical protein
VDDIKLKMCTGCKSARYCGVTCQREHRVKHKKACKKRAAELRDEILFEQPESSHYGDCPICLLPLSINPQKFVMKSCCSKLVCIGCDYANDMREKEEMLKHTCPFCRQPRSLTKAETHRYRKKRIEVNDPVALREEGKHRCQYDRDFKGAFELLSKAAEMGDVEANYELSVLYWKGEGVEKDKKKEVYHLEEAANGGHPSARYNLGSVEWNNDRIDIAIKHWIIAANLGHDGSLEMLKYGYETGVVSKEDYAAALRAHQTAVDATKSPQREAGEAVLQKLKAARATRRN